jgi:hypothetical protein
MQGVKDASGLYEVERRATYAARPGFRIIELQIRPHARWVAVTRGRGSFTPTKGHSGGKSWRPSRVIRAISGAS